MPANLRGFIAAAPVAFQIAGWLGLSATLFLIWPILGLLAFFGGMLVLGVVTDR